MNQDLITLILGTFASMIVIPWCVFVTAAIFGLRQQVAILRAELGVLRQIQDVLSIIKKA